MILPVLALLAPLQSALAQPAAPPSEETPGAVSGAESPSDKKAEAEARYFKGKKLFESGAWDAALAEFLASGKLYPNRSAAGGAATCLKRLQRFDEALDLFELLLRDFAETLPASVKITAQREVLELRGLVGTVEIERTEPGATISVDGQGRGDYPLLAPLRVAAGSHVVRVYHEGFEPFESRVEVAGGQTERVVARLRALTQSGHLQVIEQGGQALEVLVDGNAVGKTPWEGPIAPGEHMVVLLGEGELGTPPASIAVELNRRASLTLAAEKMSAWIRIEPVPANAVVALDGVGLGHGLWQGRLRPGVHKVEMAAPGFLAEARQVSLAEGKRQVVTVRLERDPTSPFWRKPPGPPPPLTVELDTGAALLPSFGGDVAGACIGGCLQDVGFGTFGVVRGGYRLRSGLHLGIATGYLSVTQTTTGRSASVQPVGRPTADEGIADDRLKLRGVLAGVFAGLRLREGSPAVHLRLGAGALIGSVSDTRTGTFLTTKTPATTYRVGPVVQSTSAASVYLAPELRVGLPLSRHLELSAGLEMLLLFSVSTPTWDEAHRINASADGEGHFAADALTESVLLMITPGVGARYDF